MIQFPKFDSYVTSDGSEHVEIEHEGFKLRATVYHDRHMGPPWKEHDGHGEVSDWTTRPKRPGERVLAHDRDHYQYYDFAGALEIAKRDGWGPMIPYRTPGIARLMSVEADFRAMKAWAEDKWHWCGVAVIVFKNGIQLTGKYDHALWGIECNYPDSDNDYLSEVADEMAEGALEAAKAKIAELCAA